MTVASEEAKARKAAYDAKYWKEHIKRKHISFNMAMPEDVELYEWCDRQPNLSQYLKGMIREDMISKAGK